MKDLNLYQRNMLAMSATHPKLARYLKDIPSYSSLIMMQSRSGHAVPAIKLQDRNTPFHSLYDPIKEGERFLSTYSPKDCLIFMGLGAAYQIRPYLKYPTITEIFIIDTDIKLFKALLEEIDFKDIITDRRIHFLIEMDTTDIQNYILSHYIPAASGNLRTVVLRQRVQTDIDTFNHIAAAIKQIIEPLSDDYTVQSTFGKKWFKNTLINLKKAEKTTTILKPVNKVIVTGAGPSLEEQIPLILEQKNSSFLIATDTSLPVLLSHDIRPDVVMSIDCQHVSYHHFIKGYPKDVPLILDLASPPMLSHQTNNLIFFSSGHPLSQYAEKYFRPFPRIDITGGNVSHAAVSLAISLGAKEIHLLGTDFSYPNGKPYARGTYIYPYFNNLQNRLNPTENLFHSFVMKNKNIITEKTNYGYRYTTRPMLSYKERLEKAVMNIPAKIIPAKGKGVPINIENSKIQLRNSISSLFSAGSAEQSWKQFLKNYKKDIENLPEVEDSTGHYLSCLSSKEKDLWYTMFPTAAAFRKKEEDIDSIKLLNKVKTWTLKMIESVIN